MIALPVPGTDTRVLTGRGPLVAVGLISATGVVIGSITGTGVAWLQRARGRLPHLSCTAGKAVLRHPVSLAGAQSQCPSARFSRRS